MSWSGIDGLSTDMHNWYMRGFYDKTQSFAHLDRLDSMEQVKNATKPKGEVIPLRFGLSSDPPRLVLEYKDSRNGNLRHKGLRIKDLFVEGKVRVDWTK